MTEGTVIWPTVQRFLMAAGDRTFERIGENSSASLNFSLQPVSLQPFPSPMQLTKHWAALLDDYAIDLAWAPDGSRLAAVSAAGPVSIFQLQGGAKLHELPGHENGSNCVAWAHAAPAGGSVSTSAADSA